MIVGLVSYIVKKYFQIALTDNAAMYVVLVRSKCCTKCQWVSFSKFALGNVKQSTKDAYVMRLYAR
jgi:cell shape-determining protein MreD